MSWQLVMLRQLVWMLLGMMLQKLSGLHSRAAHDGELVCSLSPALLLFLSGQFGRLVSTMEVFAEAAMRPKGRLALDDVVHEASSFSFSGLRNRSAKQSCTGFQFRPAGMPPES
jgi:hypothetical protein